MDKQEIADEIAAILRGASGNWTVTASELFSLWLKLDREVREEEGRATWTSERSRTG